MNEQQVTSEDQGPVVVDKSLSSVRVGYVATGAATITICCAAALVLGQIPWVSAALTAVAMVGGAVACLALQVASKRPRLVRAVFAAAGAMAVLLLQPVQLLSSLL